eukprot:760129-Hanusia_phi.AAC.4
MSPCLPVKDGSLSPSHPRSPCRLVLLPDHPARPDLVAASSPVESLGRVSSCGITTTPLPLGYCRAQGFLHCTPVSAARGPRLSRTVPALQQHPMPSHSVLVVCGHAHLSPVPWQS